MFTKHLDIIKNLKSNNPAFAYMYKKYEKLEDEIARFENDRKIGGDIFCPKTFQKLKQEKRVLHSEIYMILKKVKQ